MEPIALLGLVGLLFVKEAGVPIPVPGDLLVVGAGVASIGPGVPSVAVLAAILGAGYAGGSIQFVLVRGTLRPAVLAILARAGIGRDRLDRLSQWLERRGARGVAVARATPALRIGAIAASGLAALPFGTFLAGLLLGNGLFVSAHFALGFLLGPAAERVAAEIGGVGAGVAVLGALAVLAAVGWAWLRRRRGGYGGWLEGACPACLALTAIRADPE